MRSFLISSQNYTGQIELVYDGRDQLITVDFANGDLTVKQVEMFTRIIPAIASMIPEVVSRYKQLTVVEGTVKATFEAFWKKYDLKFNKKRAEMEWNKLSQSDQVLAYHAIDRYDKYVKDKRISKAHPETYLRNRYFENEY